jgi:hypothetical protein
MYTAVDLSSRPRIFSSNFVSIFLRKNSENFHSLSFLRECILLQVMSMGPTELVDAIMDPMMMAVGGMLGNSKS